MEDFKPMSVLKRVVYALAVLYTILNLYYLVRSPDAASAGGFVGSVAGSALLYFIAKKGAQSYERHHGTFRAYLVAAVVAAFGLLAGNAVVHLFLHGTPG
jgi:multisubunit Na+/H+ antiporter MnhB subunit